MKLKVNNNHGEATLHHIALTTHKRRYPVALTIAGSDSSGGAGIQADLKTFSALGVYGATAITAITAQNTMGVRSVHAIPAQMVHEQIVATIEDIKPKVIKIGMLANEEIVCIVAKTLQQYPIPIILDPVMVSSSGHSLLSTAAQTTIKEQLIPMAHLITPNIPEMEALASTTLNTPNEKLEAARYLISLGARAILLKGGHEEGDTKSDILYQYNNGEIVVTHFSTPTVTTRNIHGTGCTLSSAIAAHIARGYNLREAISKAKSYIFSAITSGADVAIGEGYGPVNHLFNPQKMTIYEE